MNRLLYTTLSIFFLGSSAALAQSDLPSDRSPIDRELSNPEPSAQNSADRNSGERDLTNETSNRDVRSDLSVGGEEGTTPKANIINADVTTRNILPLPPNNKAKIMGGERELTAGLLSKDANFRLIVSGPVGVQEIERLIAKLEMDKEILAAPDSNAAE